jgi:hypothetical protein
LTIDQQPPPVINPSAVTPTAKRTGSASIIVEGASPSKRRKMNSNENCSIIDDSDVIMSKLNHVFTKNNPVFFL